MKKTIIPIMLALIMLIPGKINSQTTEQTNLGFGADIVSRYIWRGINLGGSSPHIQPFIEYGIGNSGLVAGFWGSYGIGPGSAGTEADIYISYTPVEIFTLTVTDYYFPADTPFSTDDYFNYRKGATGHTIEGMASFNGTEGFPVSILFAINLYGADGTDEEGNNYNAKYIEFGYTTSYGDIGIEPFAGLALDNPATEQGAEGWYGDSGGLINLGVNLSKSIKMTETLDIPAFSSLIFNPQAGNIYMVIGLSF
ncbi:MAG: TorF family putative porin [Bacteroidales bacterium]